MKYFFSEGGSFRRARVGAKKRAANTQIKNDARDRSEINIQNRSSGACAHYQPVLDLFNLRNSGKPACRPKRVVRETRVDFCEPLQSFPRGPLADRNVRVVRLKSLAVRR